MNFYKVQILSIVFLLLCFAMLHPDENYEHHSHFGTRTIFHDNGDKTVVHEHFGNTEGWNYNYSATYEYEKYDTVEHITRTNVEFNCTPREIEHNAPQETPPNQQLDHPNQPRDESQETTHSRQDNDRYKDNICSNNSCWNDSDRKEWINDQARDREYERNNQENNFISNYQNTTSYRSGKRNLYDDFQRSSVYQICKSIKEALIGKSKKTKLQEQAQKILWQQEDERRKQENEKHKAKKEIANAEKLKRQQSFINELEQAYAQHHESLQSSDNQEFLHVMQRRNDSFDKSLHNQTPAEQKYKLAASTIGFLQAHSIDYRNFLQLSGLPIQHNLTQELIANLNNFAQIADANLGNQNIFPLLESGALMSCMAQDYNQNNKLLDAISGTNCSHGFLNYVQGMLSSRVNGCAKFATALSFFNAEITKYALATARGVARGVIASEITGIALTGLQTLAPELTAAVYAGATSIMIPIALTTGFLCSAALVGEMIRCGYLYTTEQYEKLYAEFHRIKNFAQQFYNFDQAPAAHVEHLAMLATTVLWPWQRQAIFENLMGMQKVTCTMWLDAKNFVSQTRIATHKEIANALEYIKNHELSQFNISYKNVFGQHIINLFPASAPDLVPAGMQGVSNSFDQNKLIHFLMAQESSAGGNALTSGLSQGIAGYITEFSATDVGKKMQALAQQKYELDRINRIAKEYSKVIANQAPQEVVHIFLRCHELSIIPTEISAQLEKLHVIFKDTYPGLPEFNTENPYLTMHVKHIFYPTLKPEFDETYQTITEYVLNGFHHDEYAALEKSGLFTYANKEYGNATLEAQEFFKANLNFGNGIIIEGEKTFFPSSWSREKVTEVILQAAQNRIEDLTQIGDPAKNFLCQSASGLFVEIIMNPKNVIISAYPSMKNFEK